jgi:molybdate/tungstate transport system substrate-binding protein
MNMKKILFFFFMIGIIGLLACGHSEKEEILVLHAGSLSVPFDKMASRFMAVNPGVRVMLEAHGSRTAARQVSDLKRQADVLVSADSDVIRNLLYPEFADFCIDFSGNEMVLMFRDSSRFANEINSGNWMDILLREGVQYGHSDPNSDPCGFRALLTWKLAENYYRRPGLYSKLTAKMPDRNIRPKETDLIAMLEVSELDYVFIYRSVAIQHHFKFISFPDEVNLKSSSLDVFYGQVSVRISGKSPGQWIEKKGGAMVYGITLPKSARNPEWGIKFIAFILGDEGQRIMRENGQPEIVPPRIDHPDKVPAALKIFFEK